MTGFYDRTAEYVGVLLPHAWTGLGPALRSAVAGLATDAGPVVDVGAGTGLGTAVLADALPATEIIAVEPHPALRAALLAWLAGNAGLGSRSRSTSKPSRSRKWNSPGRVHDHSA